MARRSGVQSMTGYGRAARRTPAGRVAVELRSTNHRFLDVDQRLPNGFAALQGRLSELIRARLGRGRVDLVAVVAPTRAGRQVRFDTPLLAGYYRALLELKGQFGVKGPVTMDHLLALPHAVSVSEERPAVEELWEPVRDTAEAALAELVRARRREGARLAADIRRQLTVLDRHVRAIKARMPRALVQQHKLLRGRLRALLGPGGARASTQLEGAVALVKEADIHEELVRLASHLRHVRETLRGGGLMGKQLDFIAQELMREANTIGAKVNDAQAIRHVIAIKGAIERIREQVQNLE